MDKRGHNNIKRKIEQNFLEVKEIVKQNYMILLMKRINPLVKPFYKEKEILKKRK